MAVGRACMCLWHGLRPKLPKLAPTACNGSSAARSWSSWSPASKQHPNRWSSLRTRWDLRRGLADAGNAGSKPPPRVGELSQRAMKYTFVAFGAMFTGVGGYLVAVWGAPPVDEKGKEIEDEFSHLPRWKAHLYRTYKEMKLYNKDSTSVMLLDWELHEWESPHVQPRSIQWMAMIQDPSRDKLLPDPLTEPYYQPPYTLVLEMTGVLVHPDWTYQTGWRFKKRPGVNHFLQQVGPPLFEVVVYTSEQGFTAYPILDTLDPQGYIMYRLFRDATRYQNGHHIKDLSCLNRDLSRVILVDWSADASSLQPRNALRLPKWDGSDDDRTLIDLAQFLRTIATSEVEDVRTVLDYYSQFDNPLEAFKENQRKLQEEKQQAPLEQVPSQRSWAMGLWKRH